MLKSINIKDLRQKIWERVGYHVRAITAGMGLHELRAVMRGDPPTEKPNSARSSCHTTSFLISHPAASRRSRQHDLY